MRIAKVAIILFIVSYFLGSCKTIKNTSYNSKLQKLSTKEICDKVKSNNLNYSSLMSRFSVNFKIGDDSHKLSGLLRIKKDSLMWISVKLPLGIEVARILFSQDSLKFINRHDKTYFISDYNFFKQKFGVELNYNALQAIFTNSEFVYNGSSNDLYSFDNYRDTINYNLENFTEREIKRNLKKGKLITYQKTKVSPQFFKINQQNIINYSLSHTLNIGYNKFEKIEQQDFPKELKISAKSDKENAKPLEVKLKFKKIILNKRMSYSLKIPKKYKPMKTKH